MALIHLANPWIFGVGILGNLTSFMVIVAPVPTFYRIYKRKSTESFQSIPYAVAVFSATLWLYYAVLTSDVMLLTINCATTFLECVYLAIYLTYASKTARAFTIKMILLLDLGLYGSIVILTLLLVKGKRRADLVGGACSALAVGVFVAPLSIIKLVIKTKSVEYMPFQLSFWLTLSALAWFCYGLLQKDLFIALPNVGGFIFGMAQMILYFVYMNKRRDQPGPNVTLPTITSNLEIEVVGTKHNTENSARESELTDVGEAARPEA